MGQVSSGNWLDTARARRVAAIMLAVTVATIAAIALTATGTIDWKGRPLGTDFSQVWTAGRMVLDGRAAEVWDWNAHFAVQRDFHGKPDVDVFGWHYPPPFLLIAATLAILPYIWALVVWQAATLAPLAWSANRWLGRRDGWLFVLGAPVTLICLTHGHNGFLTALLLGGGLWWLDKRPFLAGLLLGCLVYKPQFALLIPLLLIAARAWPAILGAAISSSILIGVTLAIWGWPVWAAFLESLPLTRDVVIEQGRTGWHKIFSPFAAMRAWDSGLPFAYAVQGLVTLISIAATCWLALKPRPALRNAAASAAVLLSTPYVLDYDYVVLLLGIGWLWKDAQAHGWRSYGKSLLALAWIAPLFARQLAELTTVPLGMTTAGIVLAIAISRAVNTLPSRR